MRNINFNSKEFDSLSKEKRVFLDQLSKELDNIPTANSLDYIMAISSKLNNPNINFSPKEKELLIEVLTSKMSEKEKQKFNLIKKLIK